MYFWCAQSKLSFVLLAFVYEIVFFWLTVHISGWNNFSWALNTFFAAWKHEVARIFCIATWALLRKTCSNTWKKLPIFFIRRVTVLVRHQLSNIFCISFHTLTILKNFPRWFDMQNPPSLVQIQLSGKSTNQTTHPSAVAAVDAPDAFAALMHIGELTQCDVTCSSWILTRKNTCLCRFIWL